NNKIGIDKAKINNGIRISYNGHNISNVYVWGNILFLTPNAIASGFTIDVGLRYFLSTGGKLDVWRNMFRVAAGSNIVNDGGDSATIDQLLDIQHGGSRVRFGFSETNSNQLLMEATNNYQPMLGIGVSSDPYSRVTLELDVSDQAALGMGNGRNP